MKSNPPDWKLYFVAIVLPPSLEAQVHALKVHANETYQSRAALNAPAHITLHMPFRRTKEQLEEMTKRMDAFAKSIKGFSVELKGFGSFAPRVIFIQVPSNEALWQMEGQVRCFFKTEFNLFNARYKDQGFQPHVTIAFRDLKKSKYATAWKDFSGRIFEASFMADRISLLEHDGHNWKVIHDFSLA
jgi:2'-5' RNA ligase